MSPFEQNLSLLSSYAPHLAVKMKGFSGGGAVSLLSRGEDNLKMPFLLHSSAGPSKEAKEWANQLDIEKCDTLYVFGLGLGYLYVPLKSWLMQDNNRSVIFMEDQLAILHYFLSLPASTPLLEDPQVEIADISDLEQAIRSLTQDNILRDYAVAALPSYAKHRAQQFALIQDLIHFESAEQNIRNQELAQFGVHFFNNFYRNLLQLPSSYAGNRLGGQFNNIPAIICGAGPSLAKHLPYLEQYQNRGLLFAPGSALNILSYHGILPHFGVNIDPTAETFHRQIMNRAFESPIFYRNRIYYEALTAIHGPRLFLSGAVFYKAAAWFEKQLGLSSLELEGGYNVVHAALEIARFLGCNPIILTGLDLCAKPGEHYSLGVERSPLFPEAVEQKTHLGEPIGVKNKRGEEALSYWPWIAEAQWIDRYSREHPKLKIFNASEGITLFSIPDLEWEEADSLFPATLDTNVRQAIQQTGKIPLKQDEIIASLQTFQSSLQRCEQNLCSSIDEPAYEYFLSQFDAFFLQFAAKDLRNLKRIQDLEEREKRAKELENERLLFLQQTVRVNLKIIENTLNEPLPSVSKNENLFPVEQEGIQTYFYEDGTLKTELPCTDGRLDGVVRLYYPDGQCKRELSFEKGRREGMERSWYENGQLFTEIRYVDNQPLEAWCWFPDGRLAKHLSN